jgi:transcriptional regulator with XRE-family HTH domain
MPRLPVRHDWSRVVLYLRERHNQTQAEFGNALGCSASTVSKWERGETVPAPKQRRRMEGLGTEVGFPPSDWPEKSRQTSLFDTERS